MKMRIVSKLPLKNKHGTAFPLFIHELSSSSEVSKNEVMHFFAKIFSSMFFRLLLLIESSMATLRHPLLVLELNRLICLILGNILCDTTPFKKLSSRLPQQTSMIPIFRRFTVCLSSNDSSREANDCFLC